MPWTQGRTYISIERETTPVPDEDLPYQARDYRHLVFTQLFTGAGIAWSEAAVGHNGWTLAQLDQAGYRVLFIWLHPKWGVSKVFVEAAGPFGANQSQTV
ncbi:MAG TPA: hypothetical protein VEH06_01485 [Candidatus Bathyarchaeia archaeon]|nr:hypothetical protein [Candidatus Bathyarchaeia archaeon]